MLSMVRRRALVRLIALFAFASLLALSTESSAALRRAGQGDVEFAVGATAGMVVHGRSDELRLGEASDVVLIAVRLASLRTGIALRDRHMREALETERFPDAVLRIPRTALRFPGPDATTMDSADAQLDLHGQSHRVTIRYEATRSGDTYVVKGTTDIDMRDWGITPPSRFAIRVKPEVTIKVSFEARND